MIEHDEHLILVDAGVSCKRIREGLSEAGRSPEELEAILLTHEHSDHIGGLDVLLKKHPVPVYCTAGTFEALSFQPIFAKLPKAVFHIIRPYAPFEAGGISFSALRISHDAAEPVAYRGEADGKAFALVTDLGIYDDALISSLGKLNGLYLEANHDLSMLELGPYPYALKLRIAGEKGHLSNEAAGKLLCRLYHGEMNQILLGHLSKENNYPPLALAAVRAELCQEGLDKGQQLKITAAPQRGLSAFITL